MTNLLNFHLNLAIDNPFVAVLLRSDFEMEIIFEDMKFQIVCFEIEIVQLINYFDLIDTFVFANCDIT